MKKLHTDDALVEKIATNMALFFLTFLATLSLLGLGSIWFLLGAYIAYVLVGIALCLLPTDINPADRNKVNRS